MFHIYSKRNYPFIVGNDKCYIVKPTVIYTNKGSQVTVLRKQMPSINDRIKACVFYLYEDEEAARNNKKAGGTGFFVYIKSSTGQNFHYAVTNRHVIEKGLAPVIRVNAIGGKFDTIPLTVDDWLFHPIDADIAVALIKVDNVSHSFTAVSCDSFITKEELADDLIMLGEDVFMVGRFIYHEGRSFNMPTARSGIISAFPNSNEPIPVKGMKPQEAFLIEMRSLSGFSGSPTFHFLPMDDFIKKLKIAMSSVYNIEDPPINKFIDSNNSLWLLGVDSGNFPMLEDVYEKDGTGYYPTKYKAQNHSGFSIVIPAWKIAETLDRDEFLMDRKKREKEVGKT